MTRKRTQRSEVKTIDKTLRHATGNSCGRTTSAIDGNRHRLHDKVLVVAARRHLRRSPRLQGQQKDPPLEKDSCESIDEECLGMGTSEIEEDDSEAIPLRTDWSLFPEYHKRDSDTASDAIGNTTHDIATATSTEILKVLKLPRSNFLTTNQYGPNDIHVAAFAGNNKMVEKILSQRTDIVNVTEEHRGYAALHFAANEGHYEVVETLLNQESCIVDLQNQDKETALLLAARKGYGCIVELLLLAGADVNKPDSHGNTALHLSLQGNKKAPKPLDMPTSRAMKSVETKILDLGQSAVDGRLLLACFLAQMGADIRCPNREGKTPLDISVGLRAPAAELLVFCSVTR